MLEMLLSSFNINISLFSYIFFQSLFRTTITWLEETKRKKILTMKMILTTVNGTGIILRFAFILILSQKTFNP